MSHIDLQFVFAVSIVYTLLICLFSVFNRV